ncbi:lactose ABC transporter permease [Clostridia bacterium]|nr:lactose ABC transporter permease [Clostridia bacterium]
MRHQKTVNYAKWGYIFSVPFVVVFLLFSLYPILFTTVLGFTDLRGTATSFSFLSNPFENFQNIFSDPVFVKSFGNTMILWICNFIPQIALALLLTAWFTNENIRVRGQGAFKVLIYMPNIITAATIAILFNTLFLYPSGPVNEILVQLGFIDKPQELLRNEWVDRGIVSFIQFWMWYGNTMIVLIAGVLGISPTLFEAASIDGASGVQTFFKVTLPNLRTILLYTLVTSMIGGLQMFDIPKLLLGDEGPNNSMVTTSIYIYNKAFSGRYLYNQASAASLIMFVVIGILGGILFFVMRDKDAAIMEKQRKAAIRAAKAAQKEAGV